MIDINNYEIAWAVYLVFSIVFIYAFQKISNVIPNYTFRNTFRVFLYFIILAPAYSYPEETYLAPAIIVLAMNILNNQVAYAMEVGLPFFSITCALTLFSMFVIRLTESNKPKKTEKVKKIKRLAEIKQMRRNRRNSRFS